LSLEVKKSDEKETPLSAENKEGAASPQSCPSEKAFYFSLLVPNPSGSLTILRGYLRNEKSGRQVLIKALELTKLDISFADIDKETANQARLLGRIFTDFKTGEDSDNPELLTFKIADSREGNAFFCRTQGELASEVSSKLQKGDIILLEGFLQTKKLVEGENISRISSIICQAFTLLDSDSVNIFNPLDKLNRVAKEAGIEYIDYKDTATLRKFINRQGRITQRTYTQLTAKNQRRVAQAIKRARQMALLPYMIEAVLLANEKNLAWLTKQKKKEGEKNLLLAAQAQTIYQKINNFTLAFTLKKDENNKPFGSVGFKEILTELEKIGFPCEKTRRSTRKRRSSIIKGTAVRPRVVLSESNRYLRVQAIDDTIGNTLCSSSTADLGEEITNYSRKNKNYAQQLGKTFAEQLKKSGKENIVFDRNARPYHEKRPPRSSLQSETLETKRVVKVTKGGRRFSFTVLTLVKDENKKAVAFAHTGGKEMIIALRKSSRQAQKKLITYFSVPPRTISRDIMVNYKATKIFLKPAAPGSGIKAGGVLNKLFKYLEIKDVSAKIIGSRSNKLNVIRAAFLALDKLTGKKTKRVGRGIGSGRGKTAGRGTKGQGARKSGNIHPGFEGGQTPVFRRFPKRGGGFKNKKTFYQIINLGKLEQNPQITDGQVIDFSQKKLPVKVLGEGEFTKKLVIKAAAFSQAAQDKISQRGGEFTIIKRTA
ncbi:5312_t:CDS:2, partial [Ambispora gerdemannii]